MIDPQQETPEGETRWSVLTLPRTDGLEFELTLSTATTDQDVVAAIERAAFAAGMVITRERRDDAA